MRPHVAALLLACAAAFGPTPPPRAPRQTKVYFFDKLAESIKGATDLLSGKSRMTEANTKGALRDIRRALLDASGATRSGFRVSGRGAVTVDACRWVLGTLAHCSRAKRRETASALGALLREAEEAWETLASDAFLRLETRERAKRAGY